MNKIEQLIEKRENTLMNYTINSMGEMVIKEFLKDLESLQEPTEEREEFDHLGCDHASGICFE